MESAITTLVSTFIKCTKGKENMGDKDFQKMVKNQLSNIMTDTDSKDAIKEMRQGLDVNKDNQVGFSEYMTLIGYLANSLSEQRCASTGTPSAEEGQVEAQ